MKVKKLLKLIKEIRVLDIITIILIFFIIFCVGCNKKNKIIKIHQQIVEKLKKCDETIEEDKKKWCYKKILKLVNKALQIDNKNEINYINKAKIYIKMKEYDEAIKTLKILQKIKQSGELYLYIGFLYEKIGKKQEATKSYKKAMLCFKNRIKKNEDDIDAEINIIFTKIFLYGKKQVLKGLKKRKILEDESKINVEEIIKNFDKEAFLNNL